MSFIIKNHFEHKLQRKHRRKGLYSPLYIFLIRGNVVQYCYSYGNLRNAFIVYRKDKNCVIGRVLRYHVYFNTLVNQIKNFIFKRLFLTKNKTTAVKSLLNAFLTSYKQEDSKNNYNQNQEINGLIYKLLMVLLVVLMYKTTQCLLRQNNLFSLKGHSQSHHFLFCGIRFICIKVLVYRL